MIMESLESVQAKISSWFTTDKMINAVALVNKYEEFVQSTQQFYEGNPLTDLTDQQWDEKRAEFKSEVGEDILHFINFGQGIDVKHRNLGSAQKVIVDGGLISSIEQYEKEVGEITLFPKYDGCSLVLYYQKGFLHRIVSQADGNIGKEQTGKFLKFVPDYVDPSIDNIQCEVLVSLDEGLGGLTRNKANGLVNSKHMQEEVEELATLRAFRINYVDEKWDYLRMISDLKSFIPIQNSKGRTVFCATDILTYPTLPVTDFGAFNSGNFLVDGAVAVSEFGTKIFKYYYTSEGSALVTTKFVDWNESWLENYVPTLVFDPVILNGATVQRCATGGPDNLFEKGLGEGATWRVVKIGATIPGIHEVFTTSDKWQLPACFHCSVQLDPSNVFGSGIKCVNKNCCGKLNKRIEMLTWNTSMREAATAGQFWLALGSNLNEVIGKCLNIDRWTPSKKETTFDRGSLYTLIFKSLTTNDPSPLFEAIEKGWYFSYLQRKTMELNYTSLFLALQSKLNTLNNY